MATTLALYCHGCTLCGAVEMSLLTGCNLLGQQILPITYGLLLKIRGCTVPLLKSRNAIEGRPACVHLRPLRMTLLSSTPMVHRDGHGTQSELLDAGH